MEKIMKTILSLMDSLIKATERDKLSWEGLGTHKFKTKLPDGYGVVIWDWMDEDTGIPGISVSLEGSKEEIIDQNVADQFSPEYSDLQRLLNTARRSAHDVNSVIENLEQVIMKLK